jgi:pSer/pThr/pTyr-binding forkhead associated (FHA) protein
MNDQAETTQAQTVELPAAAPLVRVTAGLGSAAQKTWNLRRPVTLIGSRRPAHIVLHDGDISHAHCVIINTGHEVLLKDLHTRTGTLCNDKRVDLTLLKDGDVISVGAGKIQVAVRASQDTSEDSGYGIKYRDPLSFTPPVRVGLLHTEQIWQISDAAVLIGRHEAARVFLDHQDVSRRHALLFRFENGPAVFDLGGHDGILVNGKRNPLTVLKDGDRMAVGPFGLLVGAKREPALEVNQPRATSVAGVKPHAGEPPASGKSTGSVAAYGSPGGAPSTPGAGDTDEEEAGAIDSKLNALRRDIATSWEHINSWQAQLVEDASESGKRATDLSERETALQARDAELRGRLHDVARFEEELEQRERDLGARIVQYQRDQDELTQQKAACDKREAEVARRADELSRREHVFAQRWTRLVSAKCPRCKHPLGDIVGGP